MKMIHLFEGFLVTTAVAALGEPTLLDAHVPQRYTFSVTNSSPMVQTVESIRSSCACIKVESVVDRLAPLESVPLCVLFDPAGMEGPVRKTIDVTLKPSGEVMSFAIEANVRSRLGFKPSDAAFGVVSRQGAKRQIEATLSGFAAKQTQILSLEPPGSPVFAVEWKDRTLKARVRDPMIPAGTYAEVWKVKTTDPELSELAFPLSVRISDALEVVPQVITVGWDDAESVRMVTLRAPDLRQFKVLSAETKPRSWGTVKIDPRPLNGWRVTVTGVRPDLVRQFSKKPYLMIYTDVEGMEAIEVPFRVVNMEVQND